MALFEWSSDYSVRIPSIDAQHQRLVGALNDLHDGMVSGTVEAGMSALLVRLLDYTAEHFAYEERLMAEHHYPRAEDHAAEHRRLTAQLVDFHQKYAASHARINVPLMMFLKDWLLKHILGSDRDYSACLTERGVT